jgi:hypothetical protein
LGGSHRVGHYGNPLPPSEFGAQGIQEGGGFPSSRATVNGVEVRDTLGVVRQVYDTIHQAFSSVREAFSFLRT